MLSRADSIGVFQVESRAQMSMLPRLQAANILRSRHRGRDRAPRSDPGRHGASLSAPPAGDRESQYPSPAPAFGDADELEKVLGKTLGRAAVPGTGDAHRHRGGRLHPRRGRSAAPRHGDVPPGRHHQVFPRQADRRHGGARLSARFRRALLQPDRRFWRIRLSGKPCRELRAAGLCLRLDEVPLPRRVRGGAAQQPADGLLRPRPDRARRPGAWRRGACRSMSITPAGTIRWRLRPHPSPEPGRNGRTPATQPPIPSPRPQGEGGIAPRRDPGEGEPPGELHRVGGPLTRNGR